MIEERIKHLVVALRVINLEVEKAAYNAGLPQWAGVSSDMLRKAREGKEALEKLTPFRDSIETRLSQLLSQEVK